MVADCGASYVIIGHSERRAGRGETDDIVRRKALQAVRAGLRVIVCVGEIHDERRQGRTLGSARSVQVTNQRKIQQSLHDLSPTSAAFWHALTFGFSFQSAAISISNGHILTFNRSSP
ncbi:MAG: triose-phosphate isomerase [Rhizobiaceae bacterium]|nr:triose-phosphate isomerase [Rhizobiaceae bacterium]